MPQHTSEEEILRTMLRAARLEAGLKQTELADRLGEPQSFISKYESGERRLTFLEVRRICDAIRVNFLEFVERLEDRLQ